MEQDKEPIRDKDAYEAICKQIEREDNAINARLNFLVVLNLALAAAAYTQIESDGDDIIRVSFLLGLTILSLWISSVIGLMIKSARLQTNYLRNCFNSKKGESFHGLPRPFFEGSNHENKIYEVLWRSIIPAVSIIWITFLTLGLFAILSDRG